MFLLAQNLIYHPTSLPLQQQKQPPPPPPPPPNIHHTSPKFSTTSMTSTHNKHYNHNIASHNCFYQICHDNRPGSNEHGRYPKILCNRKKHSFRATGGFNVFGASFRAHFNPGRVIRTS